VTRDIPSDAPSRAELEAARCWEENDIVKRRPAMTAFLQRSRLHQARWREEHGHPIGTQPYKPRPGVESREVGSRVPLEYGRETGANFVTPAALAAVHARDGVVERHQSIDHQRLWADLLSSEALAYNLFGDLAADLGRADRALHAWLPDAPGRVTAVRFAHSPGRLDPEWLNSLRAWDAAFVLDRGDGTQGIVAIDVNYHERLTHETPKPENLWRYSEVHERSAAFRPEAYDQLKGRSDLWSPWLEQLLMFSMLQHPSGAWTWGRYVLVHPAGNPDMVDLGVRYQRLLADKASFLPLTVEDILGTTALPSSSRTKLRERYLI
jgi:hypothetical protein